MRVIEYAACVIAFSFFGCSAGAPEPNGEGDVSASSQEAALKGRQRCDGRRDLACQKDQYCSALRGRCPGPRAAGVCADRPQACSDLFAPVCGCDGETYPNSCFAAAAGVAVEHTGACEVVTGLTCGGIAGIACPGFGKCVDDPSDSCDPATGGADCGGICSCIETVACRLGTHFNGDPKVCTCVPDAATP